MTDTNEIHGPRAVAQTIAAVVGVITGLLLAGLGLLAVSTITGRDTWVSLAIGACGVFTLLPFSIVGLFKPRLAACGIGASLAIFLGGTFLSALRSGQHMELNIPKLMLFSVPPAIVAGLLFYASTVERRESLPGPAGAE